MRLLPRLNLFDDLFDDMLPSSMISNINRSMKTNVYEKDGHYEFEVELPGFTKDDIKLSVENGYLMINANSTRVDEKKEGNVIHQERYSGTCTRSFYVSDSVSEKDVKARFENGILHISVPKTDTKKIESKKYIAIE